MSSMARTIMRSKRRLHWPAAAWKQIAMSAEIWRKKKAEKKLARLQITLHDLDKTFAALRRT